MAFLVTIIQIRIYGMTHFDENAEYWGDQIKPIIGAANGRFTARSVKIFGDGECPSLREHLALILLQALYDLVERLYVQLNYDFGSVLTSMSVTRGLCRQPQFKGLHEN